jgi:hypothetical protein
LQYWGNAFGDDLTENSVPIGSHVQITDTPKKVEAARLRRGDPLHQCRRVDATVIASHPMDYTYRERHSEAIYGSRTTRS